LDAFVLDVPYYRQEEPETCVAACVRMVLAFHGTECPEPQLAGLLNTRAHGASFRSVCGAAREMGVEVELSVGLNEAWLVDQLTDGFPSIVGLREVTSLGLASLHAVVVVGASADSVVVHDPERGPSHPIAWSDFEPRWRGAGCVALVLRPP
jgi:ABC-type bacteriocin/lantibiotic exporter with double-glycine peptidase domain